VLIAQVATSHGLRAPLAHLANQVFFDLSRELEQQGVSRKVGADMFGMALRAYLKKIRNLSESSTERGRSLWEAVYDFLRAQDGAVVHRDTVLKRFSQDDDTLVRGVLRDLCESGLAFSSGSNRRRMYRAATEAELAQIGAQRPDRVDDLIWAIVYDDGPVGRADLARLGGVNGDLLDAALGRLLESGRVERIDVDDIAKFRARRILVPVGPEWGWEAAVFDHLHAVVKTVATKLRLDPRSSNDDLVGGSTYGVTVWDDHPLQAEVLSFLGRFRSELQSLRARVAEHNRAHPRPVRRQRVVIYGGQCVTDEEDGP
jgi:hypothetical protein